MFLKKEINSADSHLEKVNKSALKGNKSALKEKPWKHYENMKALWKIWKRPENLKSALKYESAFENAQLPKNSSGCQFFL